MKRILIAAAAFLLAVTASADVVRGSWTAVPDDKTGTFHFNLTRARSHSGQTMALSAFSGLTESQVRGTGQTPVEFELRREAGVIAFEGTFKQGYGAGQFSFAPNRTYEAALRSLGVTGDAKKRGDGTLGDEDLLHLATQDVSVSFIRSMRAEGYDVTLDKYMAMRIFKVTPELVRELRALGFESLSADDLVASQIHGATPQYVRELHGLGMKLGSMDDFVAFRIHRVTPAFIRELEALGYRNVDPDDLVAMRIHGVSPEFIRDLATAGYENIPPRKLVAMKIHKVDPEFARKMNGKRK